MLSGSGVGAMSFVGLVGLWCSSTDDYDWRLR